MRAQTSPDVKGELARIDLYSPDTYVEGVPHDWFRLLRREAPVFWHEEPDGPGFWALTRYDDVVTVSMDPQTYSSAVRSCFLPDPEPEHMPMLRGMLLNQDPPEHTKYRRLVSRAFTLKVINSLEGHIRQAASQLIDRIAARGSCDFVRDVAAELPLQAIAEIMGVPQEDRHKIFEWSNEMIATDDPDYSPHGDDGGMAAAMQLYQYGHQLALTRRAEPRDDIVSLLLAADIDGEELTEAEFDAFFLLLLVAGNETTRNAISGGMLALLEHPDQWERLKSDWSLIQPATEEVLRWVSPVIQFRRTATRDAEVRGQRIREGEKVVMFYPSANRDEDWFADPDVFDIARTPNEHVAFGAGGPHFCLGANLARLEIRTILEEIIRRIPDIRLDGPAQRLRSNFINGIKQMPVAFTPERGRGGAS